MDKTLRMNFQVPFDSVKLDDPMVLRVWAREWIDISGAIIENGNAGDGDLTSLIQDAESLLDAAHDIEEGETVDCSALSSTPTIGSLLSHAEVLRRAIDASGGGGAVRGESVSDFALGLEQGLRQIVEPGQLEHVGVEDDPDPLSPAALEKLIGIEGLRRLHKAIARDSDAVLNHIECYVETREDALFEPDYGEYGSFEEQRSTRKKSDPTKPLGYYDEKGDPIESA